MVPCNLRFADLFCGIGGFHYAARDLGLQCAFACDIDESCRRQYERNFGLWPQSDITDIEAVTVPDHDILFAGFPCQPFSIIGDMNGMRDSRGTLFFDILRILRAKMPAAFVLENVRNFAAIDRGKTLKHALNALAEQGYDCDWRILNALNFGLPQKRERIVIVGIAGGLGSFAWPVKAEPPTTLREILEADPPHRFFASERIRRKRRESHVATCTPSIWHENKAGNISSHAFSCALRAGASYNYLLVNGERRLTPREMLRLQGFPECFEVIGSDSQIRRQVGNAVPVPMVRAVIQKVLDEIREDSEDLQGSRDIVAAERN